MKQNVSMIILNYNGWQDTIECIKSLSNVDYTNYNIIIVDNASQDKSISKLLNYLGNASKHLDYNENNSRNIKCIFNNFKEHNKVTLIINKQNFGFAKGNNIGINYCVNNFNPEYILLLNNDVVVDESFLNKLVKASTKNEKIGILGPKIFFYDHPNSIQSSGVKINWLLGETKSLKANNTKLKEVDAVSGCGMLIKTQVCEKIGLLDEDYFLYYEDIDLCVRAKNAGYKIISVPNAKIWHKVSRTSLKKSGTREFYSGRNLFIFMKKYSNKFQYHIFIIYFFIFKFWFTMIIIGYHKDKKAFIPFIKGILQGFKT